MTTSHYLFTCNNLIFFYCSKTMSSSLNGPVPAILLESLIAISGSKHSYCKDIAQNFSTLITGQDKDAILVEWRKNLPILSEENISSSSFPVELHTLTVIDAHIGEMCKHSSYSILLSIKHTVKSICNLINKILSIHKMSSTIEERIETILVPMLFDIRTEYLYDVTQQCLQNILDGTESDAYQFLSFTNIINYSYKLLIDYAELSAQGTNVNLDESILHQILRYWESILLKPMGVKAMHHFFYQSKRGSLVKVLLSFTNTQLTQSYATKILQFFENLFKIAEKSDSLFKTEELCACISELGQIENTKLRNWLSHILLGPNGVNIVSSTTSSNVATPTNMATISAIPSISDQVMSIEPDNIDIEYECIRDPVVATNSLGTYFVLNLTSFFRFITITIILNHCFILQGQIQQKMNALKRMVVFYKPLRNTLCHKIKFRPMYPEPCFKRLFNLVKIYYIQ